MLREHGEKIEAATKAAIEEKVKKVNEVKTKEDKGDIEKAARELQEEMQRAGETLYNAKEEKTEVPGAQEGDEGAEEVKEE